MAAPADRYEPLPGLFGLPGYLLRKLSPAGRRVAVGLAVLLLAGLVATAIVMAPRISETKRDNAAAERRERARAAEQERARLIAEQRPRRGRATVGGGAGAAALVPPVERAITRDVRARVTSGELDNRARRTDCRRLGRDRGRLLLACTAVTSDTATTEKYTGVVVGYSYRAAIAPDSGRFAFCKSTGRPAVGFSGRGPAVELPRVCGG